MKVDYERMRFLDIVNNAYKQLFCSISPMEFLSWGVSNRDCGYYENMPTLMLKVNGCLHKGWVYVSLNEGADLYEVRLLNNDKTKVVKVVEDVYFDSLGSLIDGIVERPPCCSNDEYHKMLVEQGC